MSTQAQIEANQANAQSSTGPVTTEGKAVSAQNFRHDIGWNEIRVTAQDCFMAKDDDALRNVARSDPEAMGHVFYTWFPWACLCAAAILRATSISSAIVFRS